MKDSNLIKSILASAAVHAVVVGLLLSQPIFFHPATLVVLKKTPPTPLEEELALLKQEQALEEALQDLIVLPKQARLPHDVRVRPPFEDDFSYLDEKPLVFSNQLSLPQTPAIIAAPLSSPLLEIPAESFSASIVHLPLKLPSPKPTIQPVEIHDNLLENLTSSSHLATHITKTSFDFEFLPNQEKSHGPFLGSPILTDPSSAATQAAELPQTYLSETPLPTTQHTLYSASFTIERPRVAPKLVFPLITAYGIPDLSSVDWNEYFEVDIRTLPREEGGYLFSLTFLPKVDLSKHHLPQNYYFLIDRSNSIEKHRYQSFKRAVLRAIASLREGDRFNVIIFDSKIARLSDQPLPYHKKNYRLVEDFLEKQPHGHYGAATDIYSSLSKVIPSHVDESEVHTAILISDGDSTLKPDKQRKLIQNWLRDNRGQVTLYTAAAGQGNNLPILELLATAGRGSLLYSDTHTGFPRKLAKLILSLRFPIAKDLSLAVSHPQVQLFPPSGRLPHLFSDHPFVLYGSTDSLSDFTVTLEGKHKDKIFTIKKPITFAQAKHSSRLLSKQWAAQQAQARYEDYLHEGKLALLEEAKELLDYDTAHSRR